MRPFDLIDALYDEFTSSLGGSLGESARALAATLRLAPERGVPWSRVFSHEVTLAAPALLAEGWPQVSPSVVRAATFAHMLAVLEAFGTDRIENRQVEATPELCDLLEAMRSARDAALASLDDPEASYLEADRATRAAIALEAETLRSGVAVSFRQYETTSLGKQSVGFPAGLALVRAAGCDGQQVGSVELLLAGVWLGLQMGDDVVDWEDDAARGGAWAVALAGVKLTDGPDSVRDAVHGSGALMRMLVGSRDQFRTARFRATALGAASLAAWATEREKSIQESIDAEANAPGFARRRHALGAWAAEVLR